MELGLKNISKKGIKAAIITMSFIQMATNGIASILANISEQFTNISISTVQFLMTFPSLFIIIVTLLAAWLCQYFSKRKLVCFGLVLVCISGILSFMFYESIIALFACAGILGIGVGFVASIAISLIPDYFEGEEQEKLMGIQTTAANAGSMIMTFVGGLLACIYWNFNYLIYLIAIPGIVLTICFIPEGKRDKQKKCKISSLGFACYYCLITLLFMLVFYIGPTNISLFIQEMKVGNAMSSGIGTTILLLGGAITGIIFGKINKLIGQKTISAGFLVLAIGFINMSLSRNIGIFYIGCFIAGSSISFVMPQCMLQIAAKGSLETITLAMALAMATSNLGTFIAPVLTSISKVVMNSNLAKDRILFTAIISIVISIVFYVSTIYRERKGV